jgi:putative ABC transport system substrate-binding protein
MQRRDFIAGLGSTVALPAMARAQQPATPVIGWLATASVPIPNFRAALLRGLADAGFAEGRNVAIKYLGSDGRYDQLPELAAELVVSKVTVIIASGSGPALVAKAATATMPIVFLVGDLDPVASGLVGRLNRPGGNITGVILFLSVLGAKRLQILKEIVPRASLIGMLVNPSFSDSDTQVKDAREAAVALGVQLVVARAGNEREIEQAFASLSQARVDAVLVGNDSFFNAYGVEIVRLASEFMLPTIYDRRDYAAEGGLIAYGTSFSEAYYQIGNYAGRILKGEKPADIPVQQPTKFELVINLNTAKALGLTIPETLLATADEVIQ